jgi:hypothetical protein
MLPGSVADVVAGVVSSVAADVAADDGDTRHF